MDCLRLFTPALILVRMNINGPQCGAIFTGNLALYDSVMIQLTSSYLCVCSAVVDCSPWVDASASFVELLNKSNELSRFVRSMRREFEVLAVRSRYLVK